MQKKVSAAVRAFGRAHKAGLALLGGGVHWRMNTRNSSSGEV